jgi:hypothetical protein
MRRFQNKTEDKGIRQKRSLGERGGWEIFNPSLSFSLCARGPEVWKAVAEEMSRPFNALTVML